MIVDFVIFGCYFNGWIENTIYKLHLFKCTDSIENPRLSSTVEYRKWSKQTGKGPSAEKLQQREDELLPLQIKSDDSYPILHEGVWRYDLTYAQALTTDEKELLYNFDEMFEDRQLFCAGRWLGAMCAQDPMDLQYLQNLMVKIKPDVIIEIGTFRGGLTYFFSSMMDILGIDHGKVLTIDMTPPDKHDDDLCPQCNDCLTPWHTESWARHVEFYQGMSTSKLLVDGISERMEQLNGKVVMVNLDGPHDFTTVFGELALYCNFVSIGSYLVVQDTKIDLLYKNLGPKGAALQFLDYLDGDWVWDRGVELFGYTQHMFLKKVDDKLSHEFRRMMIERNLIGWSRDSVLDSPEFPHWTGGLVSIEKRLEAPGNEFCWKTAAFGWEDCCVQGEHGNESCWDQDFSFDFCCFVRETRTDPEFKR